MPKCPTCGRPTEWSDKAPSRPFCSARCRLIDLGAWLSEQRGIPDDAPPAPTDEDAEPPPPKSP